VSGYLSDRFGARPFATGGMVVAAASFGLLEMLPVNFVYWEFAGILLLNGIGMGLFASPNRAGIMNSLPPERRGVGAGMSATFQNSAMVLSIGIFFTLIILGLASSLPATLSHGLMAQGVPSADAARLAALPPVSIMFAALLGYNPIKMLLGSALSKLPPSHAAYLTGHTFFPSLISAPFQHGLDIAFDFAIIACLIAALASLLRGSRYVHDEHGQATDEGTRALADADEGTRALADADEEARALAADGPVAASTVASTVENRATDNSTAHAVAVTSAGDDLEGIQGRVGRVGDPASVGGDLA
jgi:MFS family permease